MTATQGFGCMGISAFYGAPLSEAEGVELLKGVYEAGVRHYDTAEVYRSSFDPNDPNLQYNETVVGKFAASVGRSNVQIATKFFPGLHGDADITEGTVAAALDASLQRLGTDYVDVYYLHRLPSNHDVKVFMNAAKAAVEAGKVKAIGLSEAAGEKIREAHAIHPIGFVQQEWSLLTRNLEDSIVPVCAELGISIVAYSPLARNLLANIPTETPTDWRASNPRYSAENLKANKVVFDKVSAMAEQKGCTAAQLSLAWLLCKAKALGVAVIPIPGTTKLKHAKDNIASESISLTAEDMTLLEEIGAAVAGARGDESYQKLAIEGQL